VRSHEFTSQLTDYGYAAKRQIAHDIANPHAERVGLINPTTGSQSASLIEVKTLSPTSAAQNSKAVGKMGKPTALPSSPIRTVFLDGNRRDGTLLNFDVRFTPESGHSPTRSGCLLRAITGLMHRSKKRPSDASFQPLAVMMAVAVVRDSDAN
jgi:hypothetical protein